MIFMSRKERQRREQLLTEAVIGQSNAQAALSKLQDTFLVCSFCGKGHRRVRKLIAGPKVFICNECVDLCVDILAEERS